MLKLMFGALVRAAERWRGLRFTEFKLRQIAAVRTDLDAEYEATITQPDRSYQLIPAPRFQQIRALTVRPTRRAVATSLNADDNRISDIYCEVSRNLWGRSGSGLTL